MHLNQPLNFSTYRVKPAFRSFFGEEHQTFKLKMFHNLDQLRLQLERENLHGVNAKTCLQALRTQFKEFLASKGVNATDLLNQGWQQDFKDFTRCEPSAYRRELLENLDTLEAVIHKAVITYGRLPLLFTESFFFMIQINPVQAVDDRLIVSKSSGIESENNNALSKSVNETQLQQHESLVTESTTVEANLTTDVKNWFLGQLLTEKQRTNVQLTAQHNVLANEQQHTEQSEPNYDTYLLEKGDSNTTSDSTNMCHREEEIGPGCELISAISPLLKLEKHCISLEISMQQKEESFQSNKPCKNQDAPECCEFFEINDLKAQLQAKTTLICNLKNQIKSVKEASNEAKVKHEIDVLETINIELESITPIILPKVREYVLAKPHHVIAPGSSRNSQEEPYGLNDMAHNHYLEESRKKTQERNRNSKPSVMHTTSLQNTTNGSKPNPRSNNQISRSLPIRWQKRIFLHLNLQDEMNRSFIAQNSYRLERETFSKSYRSCRRILSSTFQLIFKNTNFLTEAVEELLQRSSCYSCKVVSEPELEPMPKKTDWIKFLEKFHLSLAGPKPLSTWMMNFLATATKGS
ncbi:hypothetical protein Tco_0761565 [Tanacetum coccineum]